MTDSITFYRAATVLLILCLFTVGSYPAAGQAFPGNMHWLAHLSAYGLIAFVIGLGWQKMKPIHIAIIVGAIGFVHEVTEIVTHSHGFESTDVVVNAIGALIGAGILRKRGFIRFRHSREGGNPAK